MAIPYVTGPAYAYVGFNTPSGVAAGAAFLGTCEESPRIQIRPNHEPVFNDIGGRTPIDLNFQGEEAFITLDLNRYNEPIYRQLAGRPRPGQGGVRGLNVPGDIGTLMLLENYSVALWIVFPYVTKPGYAAAGMPAGYRFPATVLVGPDDLYPLGTKVRKVNLLFHALRSWTPSTGQFLLYDHTVAGLPAIN